MSGKNLERRASRPAVDLTGAEATIRSLEEQERVAVLNRDAQALQRLWSERFMVNSPLNQIAPDRSVVLDLLQRGLIHYSSFERRIEWIRLDGDVAIVMGGEPCSRSEMLHSPAKRCSAGSRTCGSTSRGTGAW